MAFKRKLRTQKIKIPYDFLQSWRILTTILNYLVINFSLNNGLTDSLA